MLSSSPAATTAHPPPSTEAYQLPLNLVPTPQITRRHLFKTLSLCLASPSLSVSTAAPVHARGLFQMPPLRLSNRYYLVRAGESDYESLGIINTNPVAKTSVDNGLSEKGKKQTVRAALQLKAMGACDRNCWLWPSITQRAYQAAEIIASINGISRSYIVPEYSFLDARGLGAYEGQKLDSISQVYALDSISMKTKPPPISDGTPNESVSDVFVRVTQLMSILETQYSEDTIVIVSPDSDNLSVLQAGVQGLDLRRHSELYFGPGERHMAMMGDKLILRGLKFYGYHGAIPEEKTLGQMFMLDIDAWMRFKKAGQSDNLADSVSYVDIYNVAKEVVEGSSRNLLEAVAELIASKTLKTFPPITAIRVKLWKPNVLYSYRLLWS